MRTNPHGALLYVALALSSNPRLSVVRNAGAFCVSKSGWPLSAVQQGSGNQYCFENEQPPRSYVNIPLPYFVSMRRQQFPALQNLSPVNSIIAVGCSLPRLSVQG